MFGGGRRGRPGWGRTRSCMWRIISRPIHTRSGPPSNTNPGRIKTLTADSIRNAASTRLLQLFQESIDLLRRDVFVVAVVHHQYRRGPARAETLDREVRESPVLGGLAVLEA